MVANGWTLVDNLGVHDKVYFSSGELDDQHLYIRVTASTRILAFSGQTTNFTAGQTITGATSGATAHLLSITDAGTTGSLLLTDIVGQFVVGENLADGLGGLAVAASTVRWPDLAGPQLENALDWLDVRYYSYWNSTTHVGVNEVHRTGPLLIGSLGASYYDGSNGAMRLSAAARNALPYQWFIPNKDLVPLGGALTPLSAHGRRWNGYGALFTHADTSSTWNSPASLVRTIRSEHQAILGMYKDYTSPSDVGSGCRTVPYVDITNGQHKLFCWSTSGVLASMFYVLDLRTNTSGFISAPPFPATGVGGPTNAVWDGKDTIYVYHGPSTSFAKYIISTNTWVSLAALPTNPSNNANQQWNYEPFYIQGGTIPGVDSDEVWIWMSAAQAQAFVRYNVTANTHASLNGPLDSNVASYKTSWDNKRYVYVKPYSFTFSYVLDLQNIGAGWTTSVPSDLADAGFQSNTGKFFFHEVACRIRTHTASPTTYHFVGDADGVTVMTDVQASKWLARFGTFSTYQSNATANCTASATGGQVATLAVDNTTGFLVGDVINVVDRSNGTVQPSTVTAIPSSTSIQCAIAQNISANSYVTTDGSNCALFSDHFFAVTSMGKGGVQPDGQPQLYRVVPTHRASNVLAGTGGWGRKQVYPLELQWSVPDMATTGRRGTINGVYTADAVDGEIITDRDGNQYLCFTSEAMKLFCNTGSSVMAIGPIN
jgi:hypothetical protein